MNRARCTSCHRRHRPLRPRRSSASLAALLGCLLTGCSAPAPTERGPASGADRAVRLGPAGGTVGGPNGALLQVPAGALTEPLSLALILPPVGSNPALPPDMATVGATYAVVPSGGRFAAPVTVTVPFDPAQVPTGAVPRLLKSSGGARPDWQAARNATASGRYMQAQVRERGAFVVVVPLPPLAPPLPASAGPVNAR